MALVLNSTPLIYLAKGSVLELLEELPEKKIIPPLVHEEVVIKGKQRGATDAILIEKAVDKGAIERETIKDKKFLRALLKIPGLHRADAEVLAIARELKATAVMDDEKARAVADLNGITNRGTVYLLLRLQKLGLLTKREVKSKVDGMIKLGWRCSTAVYAEILEELR
jgi:predicted nucleic acid-binding protein